MEHRSFWFKIIATITIISLLHVRTQLYVTKSNDISTIPKINSNAKVNAEQKKSSSPFFGPLYTNNELAAPL